MSFLYPSFLWALTLLAIPIIIHLFNFRRYKKVYFTNVRFLRDIQKQSSATSNLKHYLVLFSRLLALAFLVFAFAQPFIPLTEEPQEERSDFASIYIDNSFSMSGLSQEVSLLELARNKAREIVKAFPDQARIQVITNERSAGQYRFLSPDQALSEIDAIEITPQQSTLADVLSFSRQSENYEDNTRYFFLSDFQENAFQLPDDSLKNTFLLPIQAVEEQNLYIDSAWISSPVVFKNQPVSIYINLVNDGSQDISSGTVELQSGEQRLALSDFEIEAGKNITDTLIFTPKESGWLGLQLQIDDYPITFDDAYYLALNVSDQLKVLNIHQGESSKYSQAFFETSERFEWNASNIGTLNYEELSKYALIILDNLATIPSGPAAAFQSYIEDGGNMILFPAADADLVSINQFLRMLNADPINEFQEENEVALTQLNENASVWADVFESIPDNLALPAVKSRFTSSARVRSNAETLLAFRDGKNYLTKYPFQNGALFLVASPLNEKFSEFPVHALFVPFLYKVAVSGGYSQNIAQTIDNKQPIVVKGAAMPNEKVLRLKSEKLEFIPGQKSLGNDLLLDIGNEVREAGLYDLETPQQERMAIVALNYNRSESVMEFLSAEDLKQRAENYQYSVIDNYQAGLTNVVQQLNQGIALWKLCVILALVFLATEALLLRFLP